ncbi:ribosome hibernation-promoting factor, HPF/YfiA family [Canibacter zhoujuaniae]|uniref:ribosome hibernation-promoting factor, HPF/YfiA family n=1 Tax=Canibacter zhoujuaniae TaxID=2708343 RepID=UPI00142223A2|nr:ribosome-associated translation inhibitor RaiA [Canibacter zhoujuaniae]
MDVIIRGRNVSITDRFEDYVGAKTEKIASLLPKAQKFEVRVSRTSDKSPEHGDRVEITIVVPGSVIRAEATSGDKFSAFDIAYGRVLERVRRAKDKRKVDHRKGKISVADGAFAGLDIEAAPPEAFGLHTGDAGRDENGQEDDYTPIFIRTKSFPAVEMTAEAAVDQMELVGHDFYLFIDAANGRPSVVYRRKGWNYGVISLDDAAE